MILENKTIFILSIAPYDGPIESTSFITAKYLAKKNTVYYIDYPGTWKTHLINRDEKFYKRKKYYSLRSDGLMDIGIPNLKVVIVPPLLPINFLPEGRIYRGLLAFNEKIIINRLKKIISKFNLEDYIYINSFNFHFPNISRKLLQKLFVYHCVDPLSGKFNQNHGEISETKIVCQSDLVVCTSRQLYNDKLVLNPVTHFIPNAADISLTSKVLDDHLKVNSRVEGIAKPVVGYFGNVEGRIDYQLMYELACAHPEKSFVFAGPVSEDVVPQKLIDLENVYFIGAIPYAEMPSVLKGFDVALIPFRKDRFSNNIFPLKLFEYLGSGKPVVATDFNPDLAEFTFQTVPYCKTLQELNEEINQAIVNDTEEKRAARLAVANANTWDLRLKEFSMLLKRHLDAK